MSELERNDIATSSISKSAKLFDKMPSDSVIQGMKAAVVLEKQISEAEKKREEIKANPVMKEEIVPTGTEIKQDHKAGEYREIIGQDEKGQDRE